MKAINSQLLELIEAELANTTQSNYYKNISINEYTYETKLTLDLLVEKYGGFIYRDDNRITLLINFSNLAPKNQAKINRDLYRKFTELEHKINHVHQLMNDFNQDKKNNYFSYMDYFKEVDDIKHDTQAMKDLINDVLEHKKG
jgi:hypothetical protein